MATGGLERAYWKRGAGALAVYPMLHSGACCGAGAAATCQWADSLQHIQEVMRPADGLTARSTFKK
jgi:hypothetical protein